jgi:hypothetical protein
MMEKSKKKNSNPVCYTPPSEPFRIYYSFSFTIQNMRNLGEQCNVKVKSKNVELALYLII